MALPEVASTDMAANTPTHIAFADRKVGDQMFIASNGGNTAADVDHVGVFAGNGWMIHSTGSTDGTVLEWVNDGWYYDNFVWGRRVIGSSLAGSPGAPLQMLGGERGTTHGPRSRP